MLFFHLIKCYKVVTLPSECADNFNTKTWQLMAETHTQRMSFYSIKMFSAIVYIVSIQRRGVKLNNELSLPLSFNKFEVLKTLVQLNIFTVIFFLQLPNQWNILYSRLVNSDVTRVSLCSPFN